jgi:hypothetical protein
LNDFAKYIATEKFIYTGTPLPKKLLLIAANFLKRV